MKPYYQDDAVTIYHSDCLIALQSLADNSVDSIVTDPPYGLAFMGKKWDYDVPSVEIWAECLRVLKPGGHLLAFAGTRTQHRMAVRIEDSGFEIRDMIAWVYGSGFPKSMDISKAIDKANGDEGTFGEPKSAAHAGWIDRGRMRGDDGHEGLQRPWMDDPAAVDRNARQYIPGSDDSRQWQGWGTALKPALEPITMARKPLDGTIAGNVLKHGVGGINVDGCRVGTQDNLNGGAYSASVDGMSQNDVFGKYYKKPGEYQQPAGRFPANLIHDGSDEVVGLFPETTSGSGKPTIAKRKRNRGWCNASPGEGVDAIDNFGDSGSAARFFYTAKADASERRNSKHPTVKPIALMRYLVRLVTPIGATVLDPFMGSGTTIEAARLESCKAIGMEREAEYCADATKRLSQGVLF